MYSSLSAPTAPFDFSSPSPDDIAQSAAAQKRCDQIRKHTTLHSSFCACLSFLGPPHHHHHHHHHHHRAFPFLALRFTGGSKDNDTKSSASSSSSAVIPGKSALSFALKSPAGSSAAAASTSSGSSSPLSAEASALAALSIDASADSASSSSSPTVASIPASKLEGQRRQALADAAALDVKPHLNLVVVGHVDAGKSTLMGHLLYLLGHVSQRQMHRFQQDSKQAGKASFAFAWVLDAHEEERTRGITVDVAVNHFETAHRQVTLLDAPGHKDFIPNMISGAAQADVAVLVVDATPSGFDDGFIDGGQTKEHAILVRSLGVSELVVAVNKMDSVGWARDRFEAVREQLLPFLRQTGFKDKNVRFVPCSGFSGDNLMAPPEAPAAAWIRESSAASASASSASDADGASAAVPTLLSCIDTFAPPERLLDRPLRMSVADVYRSQALGACTVGGKIECGSVMPGERVLLLPMGESAVVRGVTVGGQSARIARAGENVEIGLQGLTNPDALAAGQWLCSPHAPVPMVQRFEAQILTLAIRVPIIAGAQVLVHAQAVDVPGRVTALLGMARGLREAQVNQS